MTRDGPVAGVDDRHHPPPAAGQALTPVVTPAVAPRSAWHRAKVFAAILSVVVGWQVLVIGRSYLVKLPLPEPVRLASTAMLEDPVAPSRAPARYDLTIFVFSDYQCPSCRLLHPDLEQLVAADGHIRLVYKDWVVFGDRSRRAARFAIAAQWQGRHAAANDLFLHGATGLDDAALAAAAANAGIDWVRLRRDLLVHGGEIDDCLDRTDRQARSLGIPGTPTPIIGALMFSGRLAASQMEEAVRLVRDHQGSVRAVT